VSATTQAAAPSVLRRALGRWDLTAIGVNQVIGAGIFAQPAILAAQAGAWSPWMVGAVGVASMLIALSFAEVGSRFDRTGGPYLYTRAAFGGFAAFEVGWMLWFTRAASWGAVINVLASSLGYYWPALTTGWRRSLVISTLIAIITLINVRGIRLSSVVVNSLTAGKLLPLVVFIVAGVFAIDGSRLVPDGALTLADVSASGLLLIFAFGGYEVIPVVAGETDDPVCADHDDSDCDGNHDARAGRRTRHVARAGEVGDAAGGLGPRVPRIGWSGAAHVRGSGVGFGEQHGPRVVGLTQPVCPRRAG
jgi:basic amino acid/polyamine antiporter, APA family